MKCPNCGYENKEDAVYCHVCSAVLKQGQSGPVQSPDYCKNHSDRKAKWVCEICHKSFCDECIKVRKVGSEDVQICKECGGRIVPRFGNKTYGIQNSVSSYGPEASHILDPVVSGLLSLFMVGCGQAYSGFLGRGFLFFIAPYLIMFLSVFLAKFFNWAMYVQGIFIPVALLGFHIFNIYDAYSLAKGINRGIVLSDTEGGKSALKFVVVIFAITFCISLLFILGIFSLGSLAGYMAGYGFR